MFFLISGFIMVLASGRMFGNVQGASDFMLRRLVRIIPLYWMVTAVSISPLAIKGMLPSADIKGASLLFFPFDTTLREMVFVPHRGSWLDTEL